jgi:Common central domain of tyrosinase
MKKLIPLALVGLLLIAWHLDVGAKTYVRYEAHTKEGLKALASMKKAMQKLKATGCTNPISWYYQGAMHWTPDVSGPNLKNNPLCPSFNTAHPALLAAWDNCASHNIAGPSSDIHFLPWHRLYVYYMEKIIRATSGDPDFALPYWNYGSVFTLPKPFQATAGGSLYEHSRLVSLNKGKPIGNGAQKTIAKDLKQLSQIHDYQTFNKQLNSGLHGFMHAYIGGTDGLFNPIYNAVIDKGIDPQCVGCGMMGEVPSAGFDPIFWMHHSNIDRLWQNFIDANPGQNVTLAQLDSVQWPYNFFEVAPAPAGHRLIKHTMAEVLADISKVDYIYGDNLKAPAIPALAEKTLTLPMTENMLVLSEPKAKASLKTSAKITVNLPTTVQDLMASPASKARTILELEVSYQTNNKGRYEVFVDLPEKFAASSDEAQKHFVGAISFFVNDPQAKGGTHTFRYDITDELALSKGEQKSFDISVVKTHGPEEGEITVNKATVITLK